MAPVATVLAVAAAFLCTQHAVGVQLAVTPVEKVITLLRVLKMEISRDAMMEARTYDQFACFCKDLTDKKSKSITSGRDNIDSESADIESKTALRNDDIAELKERTAKQEESTKELAATKAQYAKEKAEYVAVATDLSKAISGLGSAIAALEAAKFLQVGQAADLANILALADALNLKTKPQSVTAFLQAKVDPLDPSYKYRSGGIIKTLKDLLVEFRANKKDLDDEWAKSDKSFKASIFAISEVLRLNKIAMDALDANILKLAGEIAAHRIALVNADAMLKDDQVYLKDLTVRCEARANDWDQRTQMRNGEVEAITEALSMLNDQDGVKSADELVNDRALLLAKGSSVKSVVANDDASDAPPSFLQEVSVAKASLSQQARQDRVTALLGKEGSRLGSIALTTLATRLAADPFIKIKKLIQDLIERLLAEATAEATKKGFCDEQLGKAYNDRDYRLSDANSLNNELEQLEIKQDELEEEISVLKVDIDLLKRTLVNATAERATEHDQNMATLATANDGLKAVNEATDILRAFYKEAAKAGSLLQASPVDEDTEGAGFSGDYRGKQASSKGIIGMLEVIITDFERTIRVTTATEAKAHADFVLFDRASKSDISGKEMKQELDEQDLATTIAKIAQGMSDLQTAMDLLDAALKKIEVLKPTCIDTGMSYQERVSKREEEVAALKVALCILDEDGVEPSCPPAR